MKNLIKHINNLIYWIKKLMTNPLELDNCSHSLMPQDIISAVLIYRKDKTRELLVTTTTSRLPLRIPATPHNIRIISLYCPIYEVSEDDDEDYVEIPESVKNEPLRHENRKKLGLNN